MGLPSHGREYMVSEKASSNSDWQRGIEEGWINPVADVSTLAVIRGHLSKSPNAALQTPGWPDNVKAIRFPRSAIHERGKLEIGYEVVEDDGAVYLEWIRLLI